MITNDIIRYLFSTETRPTGNIIRLIITKQVDTATIDCTVDAADIASFQSMPASIESNHLCGEGKKVFTAGSRDAAAPQYITVACRIN